MHTMRISSMLRPTKCLLPTKRNFRRIMPTIHKLRVSTQILTTNITTHTLDSKATRTTMSQGRSRHMLIRMQQRLVHILPPLPVHVLGWLLLPHLEPALLLVLHTMHITQHAAAHHATSMLLLPHLGQLCNLSDLSKQQIQHVAAHHTTLLGSEAILQLDLAQSLLPRAHNPHDSQHIHMQIVIGVHVLPHLEQMSI